MSHRIEFVLLDTTHPEKYPPLPVMVDIGDKGITIAAQGYGTATGDGPWNSISQAPIYIEQAWGQLTVHLWGDINQEEPTHTESLYEAKEKYREED